MEKETRGSWSEIELFPLRFEKIKIIFLQAEQILQLLAKLP